MSRQIKTTVNILLVALAAMMTGCTSEEQFSEDMRQSRTATYSQWKSQKEQEKREETYIRGKLTLEDALKLALVNNKSLQQVVQEKEVARGEELKSYSAILPSAEITADYTRLDEVPSFTIGPGTTVTLGDVDNYSLNLQVTQPIFAGGAIRATLNAAKLLKLFSDQAVRGATEGVVFETAQKYYNVLLNQQLHEISIDAVRSAQASLDAAQQKRTAGVASDFDVLRAQVELSNFKAEEIKNKNAIHVSKIGLLKVMGVSQDSNAILSDELAYVPYSISMEEAVRLAYQNRPDLYQGQISIASNKEALKIAESRYWPTISGFYTNQWAKPDPKNSSNIDWGQAWQTGIAAAFPLFDGFAREGEVIVQKARLRQAEIALINSEESVLSQLTGAILSIQDAVEFVDSQALNLERAKEGLRLAEVGYKEGINTQVEVLDARAALTRARSLYFESVYSHIIVKLALQKAMGLLTTYKPVLAEVRGQAPASKDANEAPSSATTSDTKQEPQK